MNSQTQFNDNRTIDLRPLKKWLVKTLSVESPFFKVIMSEKDEISASSFISKSDVWLSLIDISFPGRAEWMLLSSSFKRGP